MKNVVNRAFMAMKKLVILLAAIFIPAGVMAQMSEHDKAYWVHPTEAAVEYIEHSMETFLANYPLEDGKLLKTILEFYVEPDGHISQPKVLRSCGVPEVDKEAYRIVATMPNWRPYLKYEDRHYVATRQKYILPIVFKKPVSMLSLLYAIPLAELSEKAKAAIQANEKNKRIKFGKVKALKYPIEGFDIIVADEFLDNVAEFSSDSLDLIYKRNKPTCIIIYETESKGWMELFRFMQSDIIKDYPGVDFYALYIGDNDDELNLCTDINIILELEWENISGETIEHDDLPVLYLINGTKGYPTNVYFHHKGFDESQRTRLRKQIRAHLNSLLKSRK